VHTLNWDWLVSLVKVTTVSLFTPPNGTVTVAGFAVEPDSRREPVGSVTPTVETFAR